VPAIVVEDTPEVSQYAPAALRDVAACVGRIGGDAAFRELADRVHVRV